MLVVSVRPSLEESSRNEILPKLHITSVFKSLWVENKLHITYEFKLLWVENKRPLSLEESSLNDMLQTTYEFKSL